MKKAQASLEYSTILALVLILILISLFYLGEGVIPEAINSAKQNEVIIYQDNVESIVHYLNTRTPLRTPTTGASTRTILVHAGQWFMFLGISRGFDEG
ncbi:MAG: hypothetical protein PWQ92_1551 [Thermococcaceae archaeon]|nr:hypothetical protein [Thermococcaceae archaeon]